MNNLIKTSFLSAFSLAIIPSIAFANCEAQISRTLKFGMKGNDVKILQQFLNDFPETQIAKSGLNSRGKESGIFDSATLKAFKAFQTYNASIILKPAGLKVANGIVGKYAKSIINSAACPAVDSGLNASTTENNDTAASVDKDIAKMQAQLDEMSKTVGKGYADPKTSFAAEKKIIESMKASISEFTKKSVTTESLVSKISDEMNKSPKSISSSKNIEITMLMPTSAKPGTDVYIISTNLTPSNNIYIGDKLIVSKLNKSTDNFVKFAVPLTLAAGKYDIHIENEKGKSNIVTFQVIAAANLNEDKSSSMAPSITTISPKSGNIGTPIVITGTGFTKENTIHTTTKSFFGLSSEDGKTLKFTIDSEKNLLNPNGKIMTALPFTFFVRNANGDSNVMTLKLE